MTRTRTEELHLHEERLIRRAARPIVAVVNLWVPVEVVVRLAQTVARGGFSSGIDTRQTATNAGVVTGFLKNRRDGPDADGQ